MGLKARRMAEEEQRVMREASTWFVRLQEEQKDGTVSTAFATWLSTSPLHQSAWDETIELAPLILAAGRGARGIAGTVARPSRRAGWKPLRARSAVAAALAASIAWLVGPDLRVQLRAQHIAAVGEVRRVTLRDGSHAWLAPGAAIAFDTARGRRTVQLLRGDAYFDVAHDPAHPFLVQAEGAEVRVLGTAFEVASGLRTRVSVARGVVAVADGAGHDLAQLRAGSQIAFGEGRAPARGTVRPDRIASWREGRFIANDRPLGDVVDALRPWFSGIIVARGPGLARDRVTGLYDLRDPDGALAALARAHRVDIRRITPWIRVVTVD